MKFFLLAFILVSTVTQAAPPGIASGVEYKYISGRLAKLYFERAVENKSHSLPTFVQKMTAEEKAKWIKENQSRLSPSVSTACPNVQFIENDIKPQGLPDLWHAFKNGQQFGSREESVIPEVAVVCTKTTNPGFTSTYDCLQGFNYGKEDSKANAFEDRVKASNLALAKYAPIVHLQECTGSNLINVFYFQNSNNQ